MAQEIKRALSVNNVLSHKAKTLDFDGEWAESFGMPEMGMTIFISGLPKNGKTTMGLLFCKYLTRFGRAAIDSIEEGLSLSFKNAIQRVNMKDVSSRIIILDKESIDDLIIRLKRPKSPNIIMIDSIQYAQMTFKQYVTIKDGFRHKTFIYISHLDGRQPDGRVAKKILKDSGITVFVQGYTGYPATRYGGGKPFIIWPEGAEKYGKQKI